MYHITQGEVRARKHKVRTVHNAIIALNQHKLRKTPGNFGFAPI
jgi:hypothetical protein